MKFLTIIFLLTLSSFGFAQDVEERVTITGDSLIGRVINGRSIREVHGNVIMKQGEVTITCNKAIQYIANNEAQLIGNVVAIQDSITILTDSAYYSGRFKFAFSNSGVTLYDGQALLTANNGYYYFNENRAYFYDNVKLIDSTTTLSSDKLNYFDEKDKAVASQNVQIADTASTIFSDSLIHFRDTKISFAYNNIKIINFDNNMTITGQQLEDYGDKNLTRITGKPVLVQIDTAASGKLDTLIISSKTMEAMNDSRPKLVATDSVKIVRGSFSAVNNHSIYYRDNDELFTYKKEDETDTPLIWYDETQLLGDSVYVYLNENELDWINVLNDAFILSENKGYDFRFNQISGENIKLYFQDEQLAKTEVNGKVLSIYYLFEEEEPNGLIQSSSERTDIFFEDSKVVSVKLYGSPESEFHPEPVVEGKEKNFTLPSFIIHENRPTKEMILKTDKN